MTTVKEFLREALGILIWLTILIGFVKNIIIPMFEKTDKG